MSLTVPELLYAAGTQWQITENLLRETVMRCNLALPTNEQELRWFDEGVDVTKSGDFMERLYKQLDIGQEKLKTCDYCNGAGYDPYQNHDTTMRPCPYCK